MSILTDQEFQDAVKSTVSTKPERLWRHLCNVAQYLALIGDTEAAYAVWAFAYRGDFSIPQENFYLGDCAVTALCYYLKREDLSRGRPKSDLVKPDSGLEERMTLFDGRARRELLRERWLPNVSDEDMELFRATIKLARPPKGERFAPTELDALPYLDDYISRPIDDYVARPILEAPRRASLEVLLLGTDISARHGQVTRAIGYLRKWHQAAISSNTQLDLVLGLYETARLAFSGALAEISTLTKQERRLLVDTLFENVSTSVEYFSHLSEPLVDRPTPPTEISVGIDRSSFCFEPALLDDFGDLWVLDPGPPPDTFAPDETYPCQISLITPSNAIECIVSMELAATPPDWSGAPHVCAFPLRVAPNTRERFPGERIGTVFPNSLFSPAEKRGFDIPPGEYDGLARFYLIGPDEEFEDEMIYRVFVSLMPRGTLDPGVLKLDESLRDWR